MINQDDYYITKINSLEKRVRELEDMFELVDTVLDTEFLEYRNLKVMLKERRKQSIEQRYGKRKE